MPDPSGYLSEAVPVGDAHFWLISRDTNYTTGPGQIAFGLVDESSKLNLNRASSNMLAALMTALPRANPDLASSILDWRDTNGGAVWHPDATQLRLQPYSKPEGMPLFESGGGTSCACSMVRMPTLSAAMT